MLAVPPAHSRDAPLLGIRGWLVDAPEPRRLRSWQNGALIVDGGLIAEVGAYETLSKKPRPQSVRWLHSERVAVFPGLIDLHAHLPQYPAVARGPADLLPWLRERIFPLERAFSGARARRESGAFFAELARHGTTTAMLYAAIFEESAESAFQVAAQSGLRVIMGKMMMDRGSYGELPVTGILAASLAETERLIAKWHGANRGLIEYAVTPRFALSCSEELLRGAAELARRHGTYLQTHLAENLDEIAAVRQQFPWAADYTDVYEQCGLLAPRTVLGHCVHLSSHERSRLAAHRAAVAHCPTANLFLRSGILDLAATRAAGVRVGLGSDVAAGPELNLWRVMRGCIEAQTARSFFVPGTPMPSPGEAFHLATQAAADVLGKGRIIGSFEIGKEADLVVLDYVSLLPYRTQSPAVHELTADDLVSLCIHRGGPDAVIETFVRGQSVYRAPEPELF